MPSAKLETAYLTARETPARCVVDLAYELDAEGDPALVCIHGYGDNSFTWKRLRSIAHEWGARTLAVDLPAFGATPLPPGFAAHYTFNCARLVLRASSKLLGGAPILLLGNSLGGSVALAAAALDRASPKTPSVAGLVLFAPGTEETRPPPFVACARWSMARWIELAARGLGRRSYAFAMRCAAQGIAHRMLAPGRRADPRWLATLADSMMRPRAWSEMEAVAWDVARTLQGRSGPLRSLAARLPALDLPVELVRGELDRVVGLEELAHLARRLPNARLHRFEGVGHCAHLEAPLASARLALETARRASLV